MVETKVVLPVDRDEHENLKRVVGTLISWIAQSSNAPIRLDEATKLLTALEGRASLEPGTIEPHAFGSKAGDPDWCYYCGEHRNHPAHAGQAEP